MNIHEENRRFEARFTRLAGIEKQVSEDRVFYYGDAAYDGSPGLASEYQWMWMAWQARAAERRVPKGVILDAMQHCWNDWICDTECIPDDFEIHGPRTTQVSFMAGRWAQNVEDRVRALLQSDQQPEQVPPATNWEPSGAVNTSIHGTKDPYSWADYFLEVFPNCGADRDTMAGWFANAMMARYDFDVRDAEEPFAAQADCVAMPASLEQARAMAIIGLRWLSENAPDELNSDPSEPLSLRGCLESIYRHLEGETSALATAIKATCESGLGYRPKDDGDA